jgi:hypothetical protein
LKAFFLSQPAGVATKSVLAMENDVPLANTYWMIASFALALPRYFRFKTWLPSFLRPFLILNLQVWPPKTF